MAERDDEAVGGQGWSSVSIERADGRREVCVNRFGFSLAPPAPGVTVGNLRGTSEATVPADTRESRLFLFNVAQELRRQAYRDSPLPPPNPKPTPSKGRRRYEQPRPCPECTGDDPWCDLCGGTGAVTDSMLARRSSDQD